jgi:hypothetical protein
MISVSVRISKMLRMTALMIGLLSISISVFEYRIEDRIENEFEANIQQKDQDHKSDSSDGKQFYLPDYQATISSFQLHLDYMPSLLGQIPVLIAVRNWFPKNHPLNELNFFRTLFGHIISPNAP